MARSLVRLAAILSVVLVAGCGDGGDGGGGWQRFGAALGAGLGGAAMYQASRPQVVQPVFAPQQNITCQRIGTFTNCHAW